MSRQGTLTVMRSVERLRRRYDAVELRKIQAADAR